MGVISIGYVIVLIIHLPVGGHDMPFPLLIRAECHGDTINTCYTGELPTGKLKVSYRYDTDKL